MLAIGIDPGTAICGFGLVEMVGNKLTPIHYGAVFTDKDMLPELRLKKIYDELSVLLDEYRPDVMSVEQLFFNRNVTTAISVGQARGVALLTAANRGIQITEFTPMQIKQAVVGYGGANKEQVTFMVQKLLNIRTKPKPDDVADALAVAICGLHTAATRRWQELKEMIGSIKGKVAYLANEYCLLETNSGVGYRVFMPAAHLGQLAVGMEARVHTYMAVREDAILLFGFLNQEYYNLFLLLLGVSGVGPKVALGILSAVKPDDFYLAVQSRDLKVLTKLPGIGKKTAERLLLELKDKVGGIGGDSDSGFADTAFGGGSAAMDEAIEALCALGYSNSEIMPALKQIPNYAELSSEVIIKQALKLFAGRK